MTADPLHSSPGTLPDPATHSPAALGSVVLAGTMAALVTFGLAIFGIAFAIGGEDATSDNWVGMLTAFAVLGGLAGALMAFVLAVLATVRHERWTLLWLPLTLFPALLAFLVLGEAFWWE